MSYYGMQRGDYYRGDPFLGALLAPVVKTVAGGAIGKAIGRAGKWVGKKLGGAGARVGPVIGANLPAIGAGVSGVAIGQQLPTLLPSFGAPGNIPFFGEERKRYRKMNPLNPRALKRAIRRAEGFEKFAKKTVNALYKTSSCGCSKRTKRFKRA